MAGVRTCVTTDSSRAIIYTLHYLRLSHKLVITFNKTKNQFSMGKITMSKGKDAAQKIIFEPLQGN